MFGDRPIDYCSHSQFHQKQGRILENGKIQCSCGHTMKNNTFKQLIKLLEDNVDCPIRIMLPNGYFVWDHFHITEVGRLDKKFIDCGGKIRTSSVCSMQVWVADDVDHRINSSKLLKILKLSNFDLDDLAIEIEYEETTTISQYVLMDVEKTLKGLLFVLDGKHTGCLAPDKCGIK